MTIKKKEQRCALAFINNNKKLRCAHVVRTKRQRCALVRSPLRPNKKTASAVRSSARHPQARMRADLQQVTGSGGKLEADLNGAASGVAEEWDQRTVNPRNPLHSDSLEGRRNGVSGGRTT